MERQDDFEQRRKHLKDLTEKQLEERFWELCSQLMDPIVDMASKHTSPSIERSVLLRMGFSSIESKAIVEKAIDKNLIQHGAGHLVYKLAQSKGMEIREAGLKLAENELWEETSSLFQGGAK
ncbi:D-ornithine 4,5-aminomutase subunit OraS [Spirochaeta isovalerica]|uniref:D-ornithine 4,5-aminomutase subunit alpha n=1 Tax=Spirochaeta isovalerica TaxID=150 RepID=A0A841RHE1_9SPIO|nr:D-ornithine 4,5-aminomutase subunit alpha [Spirochaeta isovalerica]